MPSIGFDPFPVNRVRPPAPIGRPVRYPGWRLLSTTVDLLTVATEHLRFRGDHRNADRLLQARELILDVALGVPIGRGAGWDVRKGGRR